MNSAAEFKGLVDWKTDYKNVEPKTQPFQYFTHSTSEEHKKKLQKNGVLEPFPTPKTWKAPLARKDAPKGSWFSMTLYKDKLPTLSPYGSQRVRKEAGEMIREIASNSNYVKGPIQSPRLFLETVVFHVTNGANKRTARLILVNRGDGDTIDWCGKYCNTELDLFDNPFMKIQTSGVKDISKAPITQETHTNVEGVPDTWVVLLVPYDVSIAGCTWDVVKT